MLCKLSSGQLNNVCRKIKSKIRSDRTCIGTRKYQVFVEINFAQPDFVKMTSLGVISAIR